MPNAPKNKYTKIQVKNNRGLKIEATIKIARLWKENGIEFSVIGSENEIYAEIERRKLTEIFLGTAINFGSIASISTADEVRANWIKNGIKKSCQLVCL